MKQRRYVKALIVLGTLMFMIGFLNGPSATAAKKEVIKLNFGAGHPTAAPWVSFASDFFCKEAPKRVDARTNYKLEISELWGGSVAKLGEVLEAVEIGILDMGIVIIGFDPTKCYLHNWQFNIPTSINRLVIPAKAGIQYFHRVSGFRLSASLRPE